MLSLIGLAFILAFQQQFNEGSKKIHFEKTQQIARTINGCKLNAPKNKIYDIHQLKEIASKLFNESTTGFDNQIADNHKNTTINNNDTDYHSICDYPYTPDTFCTNFDKICTNKTKERNTTNCHCLLQEHFCQLNCKNSTQFDTTVCEDCSSIFELYERPSITLYYNHRRSFIFVKIKSYLKLLPLDNGGNLVYCYTDAHHALHDVTYKYNFDKDLLSTYNDTYKYLYYQIQPQENYMGHYWCTAFEINYTQVNQITSQRIIAPGLNTWSHNINSSFTMNVTICLNDTTNLYPLTIHEQTQETIEKILNNTFIKSINFLHLYPQNHADNSIKIAYRLYLADQVNTSLKEVINLTKSLVRVHFSNVTTSSSYCMGETTTSTNGLKLTWPDTPLGETTMPEELCLQNNSDPVTRTCLGEYLYGTFWSDVSSTCVTNSGRLFGSNKTVSLYNLFHSEKSSEEKLQQLRNLLVDNNDTLHVDAHFVAQILNNVTHSSHHYYIHDLIQAASDFMDIDGTVLKKSQQKLNSTDTVLYSIDKALTAHNILLDPKKSSNFNSSFFHILTKNIHVQVSSISKHHITGAAFYGDYDHLHMVPIHSTIDVDNIPLRNLKLAAFITETQLEQLADDNLTEAKLVVVLFRRNSLFINGDSQPSTTGYQVGLYISGFKEPFMLDHVRVLIKPWKKYRANLNCFSWSYGVDQLWYHRRGKWITEMMAEQNRYVGDLYLCRYWHMTHYGILVDTEETITLSVITAIGCALSTLGGVAVIITAVAYRTWRENSGTKILLNFVVTIILENVFLTFSTATDNRNNEQMCIFIGALLHYCLLAHFSWMMVVGYLQYQRFVKVFFTVNVHFVIGAAIIAWGLPLIPVITLLVINKDCYHEADYCYLKKDPLFFGVFLPISIILTINMFIFARILRTVCSRNSTNINDNKLSVLHLRLMILLFFLLGMYWVFGISAKLLDSTALDYFFCISAALQGLVLFLYFIAFNKVTRNFWLRQLRRSQTLVAMQAWLQQKTNTGNVELTNHEITKENVKIQYILRSRTSVSLNSA